MKNMFKKTAAICIFAGLLTTAASAADVSQLDGSISEPIENAPITTMTGTFENIGTKMLYNYEGVASVLNQIGILRGNGTDFMLDQIPDRIQACVMVVRMRGEEAQALAAYEAGEITCPFTDITDAQAWAKPYLAWLYDKKITLGVGDGKFGNSDCTAQMYTTFMLRALGYEDVVAEGESADFSFDNALTFAGEKALWNGMLDQEEAFHRGVMAAVTYQTLTANVKSDDTVSVRLLESLAEANAVDADAAQALLDQINTLDQMNIKCEKALPNDIRRISCDMNISVTGAAAEADSIADITAAVPETVFQTSITASLSAIFDEDLLEKLSVSGSINQEIFGSTILAPIGMWIKDDIYYIQFGNEKVYYYQDMNIMDSAFGDVLEIMPYYAITAVDVVTDETGKMTVTYDFSDYLMYYVLDQFDTSYYSDEDIRTPSVVMSIVFNADGTVDQIEYILQQTELIDWLDGTYALEESCICFTASNIKYGNAVTITYPDFTDFKEITE